MDVEMAAVRLVWEKDAVMTRALILAAADMVQSRTAHNNIVIVLLVFDFTIQYIGIVRHTNTLYWYCPTDQYNKLVLSDRPIQYVGIVRRTNTI